MCMATYMGVPSLQGNVWRLSRFVFPKRVHKYHTSDPYQRTPTLLIFASPSFTGENRGSVVIVSGICLVYVFELLSTAAQIVETSHFQSCSRFHSFIV